MLYSYSRKEGKIIESKGIKENALWYDLLNLKEDDKKEIESKLNLKIPTRKEMGKIGASDRLYVRNSTLYMTSSVIVKSDSDTPTLDPITFIINPKYLVTLRYAEPKPFETFKKHFSLNGEHLNKPIAVFLSLLETLVDRLAEFDEQISFEIDTLSREIFKIRTLSAKRSKKLGELLTRIGKKGNFTAKMNESLMSFERLLNFFNFEMADKKETKQDIERIKVLQQDVKSITDHLNFLSHKINFLLDATLGYINIEQSGTTKVFTIVAVIFLPPTLIGTIYGMNFKIIPEFYWPFGYPFALFLILASAILPFLYFKRKGWL